MAEASSATEVKAVPMPAARAPSSAMEKAELLACGAASKMAQTTAKADEAVAAASKSFTLPELMAKGEAVYNANCAACHQASGQGLAGAFPPLAGSKVVNGDGAYAARVVLYGLEGRIGVGGQTIDGNMPGLGSVLSDVQIVSVLNYIRNAWNNKAAPVNEGMVKAERSKAGDGKANLAMYPR